MTGHPLRGRACLPPTGGGIRGRRRASARGAAAADLVMGLLPSLRAFAIPMRTRFRGITVREGALIEGPAGLG